MQHCFRISPCHGLNSNCIVVPYFFPKPFLFLISNQTRSLWGLLDQMWHIMYFIWWNHSSTCAWVHSWLDLICLGDVCNSDSSLTSHQGRQFFFRGQPRACEMWSVTGMTTVRFICQMGTRLGMLFRSRTGPIFSSKAAQCLQLGANRIFLSLWKTQPDLWVEESYSLMPSKVLTTPGGQRCNEKSRCTNKSDKASNFSNSWGGKIVFRLL